MSSDAHIEDSLELLKYESEINEAIQHRSSLDFMTFVRSLMIPSQLGPAPFDRCMAPFQKRTFEDLAPSLEALRDGEVPENRRYWIERTKKASKDADLAIVILWLLLFPKRPFYIQVGAGNKEQASIVQDRIEFLVHYNPWMLERLEIVQWEVRSRVMQRSGKPMAHLNIMATNINAAHGGIPDLLVINELSHIDKWEFAQNLMDNADGVAQGMAIIATNAGFKGTPAEVWRRNAIGSEMWAVHILAEPAPWHDKATIEDAKQRNTKSRFLRLWKGRWVSGKGDALDEQDIERCFTLTGPLEPKPDCFYVKGFDLGITHDHSAVVCLEVSIKDRTIKTAYWEKWAPMESTGEVDLDAVEKAIFEIDLRYRGITFGDPTEARLMMQRLSARIDVRKMTFSSPKNLNLMAQSLIQVVETGMLHLYDDMEGTMRRDFGKFNIVEKTYGYRLEAVSDEFGHADVGTALAIALPGALDMLASGCYLLPGDEITIEGELSELEEAEVDRLPASLRDLYGMSDPLEKPTGRDTLVPEQPADDEPDDQAMDDLLDFYSVD